MPFFTPCFFTPHTEGTTQRLEDRYNQLVQWRYNHPCIHGEHGEDVMLYNIDHYCLVYHLRDFKVCFCKDLKEVEHEINARYHTNERLRTPEGMQFRPQQRLECQVISLIDNELIADRRNCYPSQEFADLLLAFPVDGSDAEKEAAFAGIRRYIIAISEIDLQAVMNGDLVIR